MSLRSYLNKFRLGIEKLEDYGFSESLEIKEEIRANKQAVITANVVLINGSSLHIKEYIDARFKIERINYAYHYQDSGGKCLFRYDNAVHRPPLGFDEHKHTKDGTVIEATLPEISDLVDEILESL
jgi:hypothetical protein